MSNQLKWAKGKGIQNIPKGGLYDIPKTEIKEMCLWCYRIATHRVWYTVLSMDSKDNNAVGVVDIESSPICKGCLEDTTYRRIQNIEYVHPLI